MKIHKETISPLLWDALIQLMQFPELESFRLVGGTSLSLRLGHRISVDIDLFTDAAYGSIDFEAIDQLIKNSFAYVSFSLSGNDSMGKSYFVGKSEKEAIKLDLFYTDRFVFPLKIYDGIRFARFEEIVAMKFEVIGHQGRKKDFWDIHELLEHFTLNQMLGFYKKRYPFGHSPEEMKRKLTAFQTADDDLDPICLKGKYWELIKLDITEAVENAFR